MIINSLGPVYPITEKKNKWFSFRNQKKMNAKKSQVRKIKQKCSSKITLLKYNIIGGETS